MKLIDLRSDTVTKPDKNIIEEALQAKLGDDEYGEDPTVNNLQEKVFMKNQKYINLKLRLLHKKILI